MYGLLNKMTDNLFIRAKDLTNDTLVGMLVLNATNQTLSVIDDQNDTASIVIGMQFDYRGNKLFEILNTSSV